MAPACKSTLAALPAKVHVRGRPRTMPGALPACRPAWRWPAACPRCQLLDRLSRPVTLCAAVHAKAARCRCRLLRFSTSCYTARPCTYAGSRGHPSSRLHATPCFVVERQRACAMQGRAPRSAARRAGGEADQGGRGAGGAGQNTMSCEGAAWCSFALAIMRASGGGPGLRAQCALSGCMC